MHPELLKGTVPPCPAGWPHGEDRWEQEVREGAHWKGMQVARVKRDKTAAASALHDWRERKQMQVARVKREKTEKTAAASALHDVMNAAAAPVTPFADAGYDRSVPDPPAYSGRYMDGY